MTSIVAQHTTADLWTKHPAEAYMRQPVAAGYQRVLTVCNIYTTESGCTGVPAGLLTLWCTSDKGAVCCGVHLQGCSVGYAMLASMPEMNEKISVMLQMGPVVFIDFFRAPFLRAMAGGRAVEVRAGSAVLDAHRAFAAAADAV